MEEKTANISKIEGNLNSINFTEISSKLTNYQILVNKMSVDLEEKGRQLRKLNSDFFNLYNKVRWLSIWTVVSSICFTILIIISYLI